MLKNLYSIFDAKAGVFNPPFSEFNHSVAIRGLVHGIKTQSQGSVIAAHPEDYHLYFVGMFDDEKGSLHFDSSALGSLGCVAGFLAASDTSGG